MFISEMFQFLLFLLYYIVILKTECVKCKCDNPLKQKSLYTRDGLIEASHFEFRCSAANRSKNEHCKSGYYYGYCYYSCYKSSILNVLAWTLRLGETLNWTHVTSQLHSIFLCGIPHLWKYDFTSFSNNQLFYNRTASNSLWLM